MLSEKNFLIAREDMVKEDGKFYMMMRAVPRASVIETDRYELTYKEHYYYGRLLLEQKHRVLQDFLHWELELCENIRQNLHAEQTVNTKAREKEMEEKIDLIHCGLKYYK
jgi:tRNA (adenine22-N1)-methyltransferase